MDESAVHIFWDNSNLFLRLQDTADDVRSGTGGLEVGHRLDVRINFKAMRECPTLCVGMTEKERHVYEGQDRERADRSDRRR
jgi:hypothetical protein